MVTYEQKLKELAEADESIVVMTSENRAAIRNLPQTLGKRFIDVGIAEQTMVGAAAGLALRGKIPVVHALATFLTLRAFEFVRTDIGIGNLPVKLVGGVPGFLSDGNGPTHQALEDVSIMRGIPNMNVFCPADQVELVAGLPHILKDKSPWYIRFTAMEPVVNHYDQFAVGKAEILVEGMDIALLTYGFMNREAWMAKEILESKGFSVRFINLRTLKPVDEVTILSAAKECSMLVTIEDHFLTGGLYSIVSEILVRYQRTAKVLPFALNGRWFRPGLLNDVLAYEGFTSGQIASRVMAAFEERDEDLFPEELEGSIAVRKY
ncbi:MAG TPA: transketolase C-terminal domain-containing protein [Bacteroidota bacterium]|nr:transketolase C-terminal domain-containing protein [Bacteroidota bacterium]